MQPESKTIGLLFDDRNLFFVPKYQRGYRWEEKHVNAFISDIELCCEARENNEEHKHFFGGILSISHQTEKNPELERYELIDGQQRVVTFTLLAACIIRIYRHLLTKVASEENALRKLLKNRIDERERKYLYFEKENQDRQFETYRRVEVSKADNPHYIELMNGKQPTPRRHSHENLTKANRLIEEALNDKLEAAKDITQELDILDLLERVISYDCEIIHIVTKEKKEAYRLFQVLNDRGVRLGVGDLLRATTLERLDRFPDAQQRAEQHWDDILKDNPNTTENYLKWILSSYSGKSQGKPNLMEDFLKYFFLEVNSKADATKTVHVLADLERDLVLLRDLIEGQWPYEDSKLSSWKKKRLYLLIKGIGHTSCMPLLVAAARHLKEQDLYRIIDFSERFFFRYKCICNQRENSINARQYRHAAQIRKKKRKYNLNSYRDEILDLQRVKCDDKFFRLSLEETFDKKPALTKNQVKYFLCCIEYYREWYRNGANGMPSYKEDIRPLEFGRVTIEHIYPRGGWPEDKVDKSCGDEAELKPLVENIGNLTIIGGKENEVLGKKPFSKKKEVFQRSNLAINRYLSSHKVWTARCVEDRRRHMLKIAQEVFSIKA